MTLLALSTSTAQGSLCIFKDSKLLYEKAWLREGSHAEVVTLALESALNATKLSLNDISLLAVDQGPGSFTGIRVAINTVKTLSYSHSIPVVALNSLKIMALDHVASGKNILSCLNAFRNEVYASGITANGNKEAIPAKSFKIAELMSLVDSDYLVVGNALDSYKEEISPEALSKLSFLGPEEAYPQAKTLGNFVAKNYESLPTLDWKSLSSLYLKLSAAEEKLNEGLLKPLPKL